MKAGKKIFGIDNGCVDIILSLPTWPGSDESAKIGGTTLQGGGKVATALVAAARLGSDASIIGRTGKDSFGQFVLADFIRNQVDTRHVTIENGNTPYSIVLVEELLGCRTILWNSGSLVTVSPGDLPVDALSKAFLLHLAKPTPAAIEAAKIVKSAGGHISYDGDFVEAGIEELIPFIDHFIASLDFAFSYTKSRMETPKAQTDFLDGLISRGVRYAALTMGKNGVLAKGPDGYERIPAFDVVVKDTTGAGDVFHGAYLAAIAKGISFREALVYASATAALKCMYPGGRAGIPTLSELDTYLRTGEICSGEREKQVLFYQHCFNDLGRLV
jgi:sugar/nucleoside kinase (ribokinase family)